MSLIFPALIIPALLLICVTALQRRKQGKTQVKGGSNEQTGLIYGPNSKQSLAADGSRKISLVSYGWQARVKGGRGGACHNDRLQGAPLPPLVKTSPFPSVVPWARYIHWRR